MLQGYRQFLIVYIKAGNIYVDFAKRCWSKIWYFKLLIRKTIFFKGKNKKVIGLIKDESDGEMTRKFNALRAKTSGF